MLSRPDRITTYSLDPVSTQKFPGGVITIELEGPKVFKGSNLRVQSITFPLVYRYKGLIGVSVTVVNGPAVTYIVPIYRFYASTVYVYSLYIYTPKCPLWPDNSGLLTVTCTPILVPTARLLPTPYTPILFLLTHLHTKVPTRISLFILNYIHEGFYPMPNSLPCILPKVNRK